MKMLQSHCWYYHTRIVCGVIMTWSENSISRAIHVIFHINLLTINQLIVIYSNIGSIFPRHRLGFQRRMSEEKSKSTAVEVGASAERKKAGASTHGEKPPVQQISRDEFINSVAKGWDRGRGSHLLYFSGSDDHKFWPFRLNELDALTEMFVGKDAKVYDMSTQVFPPSPFIRADFPNDESVLKIMDRSMTLKGAYEVIARSSTLDSLVSQLQTMTATDELKKIMHADSFHLNITAYGYSLTASERQTMRDALSFVPFPETVDVKSPAKRFVLLVECSTLLAIQSSSASFVSFICLLFQS